MLFTACLSFTMFIFLLTPFYAWDRYWFESNFSLVLCIKVLLMKKHVMLSCSYCNMCKYFSLMSLYLCLSRISLRALTNKMSKMGGFVENIKRGEWQYRGSCLEKESSNLLHTMTETIKNTKNLEKIIRSHYDIHFSKIIKGPVTTFQSFQ